MPQQPNSHAKMVLTCNQEALCFNKFVELVTKCDCVFYAIIKHEADNEDACDHYHAVIDYGRKPKTFDYMHDYFKGAHVEACNSVQGSCAYLTHETQTAKDQKKKLYPRSIVITNDLALYNEYADKGSLERFNSLDIVERSIECGSYINMIKRFGVDAVQPYLVSIKDILTHYNEEYVKIQELRELKDMFEYCYKLLLTSQPTSVKCELMLRLFMADKNDRLSILKKYFEDLYNEKNV